MIFCVAYKEYDDHRSWKEIPTQDFVSFNDDLAHIQVLAFITDLQSQGKNILEVRWNWIGSLQGHYVPGPAFWNVE